METPEEIKQKKLKTFFMILGIIFLLIMVYAYIKEMKRPDEA
jgi:hypothetical protein